MSELDHNDCHHQNITEWAGDHLTDDIMLILSPGLVRSYAKLLASKNPSYSSDKSKACCEVTLQYIKRQQGRVHVISPLPDLQLPVSFLENLQYANIILTWKVYDTGTMSYEYSETAIEQFITQFKQSGTHESSSISKDWKTTSEANQLLEGINDLAAQWPETLADGVSVESPECVDSGYQSEVIDHIDSYNYQIEDNFRDEFNHVTSPMLGDTVRKMVSNRSLFLPPDDNISTDSTLSQQIAWLNERNGEKWDKL